MKYLKFNCLLIFACIAFNSSSQCSFQYISNDTVFQDYIEFIYPKKNADEIITIGSRINRGIVNDSVFNAPVFQTFDYCGNILNNTLYYYIGNYKLRHIPIQTHNTYKEEPIENTAIRFKDDEFLIVDKAVDTLLKKVVLILFKINEKGVLKTYKKLDLNNHEANQTGIKNVIELKDGKVLVILSNYFNEYTFYYFDENSDFLYKKSFSLERGIRSIKEVDNGDFVCTSLAYDNSSFQFYRFDTSGNIKWIRTPYNGFGSASEVLIENNKIYVTGGVNGFGVFLICDINGIILKEFRYDTFYCQQRFCSAYMDTDNSLVIGGYVQHCQLADSSGSDVVILKIDTTGTILWNKLYDFRNSLGTSGQGGYYTDYGGFEIAKTNDEGIIISGMSRYSRAHPGGVMHENALLIKTDPLILTSTYKQANLGCLKYELLGNLLNYDLNISGPTEFIKHWVVYSLQGEKLLSGNKWYGSIKINSIESGMYALEIIDQKNHQYILKFVKKR